MAFVLATSCYEADPVNEGNPELVTSLSGSFLTKDGTPISSAIVNVFDAEGTSVYEVVTDTDGNYTIEYDLQNTVNSAVSFSKDGKLLQLIRLETLINIANTNSAKRGDILLEEEYDSADIYPVKVVDKVTKEPLEGAVITIGGIAGATMESTTNSEGIAKLKLILGGMITITASKEGYLSLHYTDYVGDLVESGIIELVPKEVPDGTTNNTLNVYINGLFFNSHEFPVPFRMVNIVGENGFKDSAMTGGGCATDTDKNPCYAIFTGLKSGTYKVIFDPKAGDFDRAELEVFLKGNESKTINLGTRYKEDLCKNNTFILNFKDENGKPIQGGKVSLQKGLINSYYHPQDVPIGANGSVKFTEIPKGEDSYTGVVDCEEETGKKYKFEIRSIVFDCNQTKTADVNLVLTHDFNRDCCDIISTICVFKAVNPDIMPPVLGEKITVTGPNGYYFSGLTDFTESDGVLLRDLCNGKYTITWEKKDGTKEIQEVNMRCKEITTPTVLHYKFICYDCD
jgi:hypothetical protein